MNIEDLVGLFVYIHSDNYRSNVYGELKKDENGYFIMDKLNCVCFCQTDIIEIRRPTSIYHIILK